MLRTVPFTSILYQTGTLYTKCSEMATELNWTRRLCFCQFVILSLDRTLQRWFTNVDNPHTQVHSMVRHIFLFGSAYDWSLRTLHAKSSRTSGPNSVQLLTIYTQKPWSFSRPFLPPQRGRVWMVIFEGEVVPLPTCAPCPSDRPASSFYTNRKVKERWMYREGGHFPSSSRLRCPWNMECVILLERCELQEHQTHVH